MENAQNTQNNNVNEAVQQASNNCSQLPPKSSSILGTVTKWGIGLALVGGAVYAVKKYILDDEVVEETNGETVKEIVEKVTEFFNK